jgi:hypothetical protein
VNGVPVSYPRYENLAAMPPKIGILKFDSNFQAISQLWENVPNKRVGSLQTFIDGLVSNKQMLEDTNLVNFFKLKTIEKNPIYQFSNELVQKILKFLSFQDLFRNVTSVSNWLRKLVFSSYTSVDFTYIKQSIYFGQNIVSIKSIHDLESLVQKFVNKFLKIVSFL